MNELKKNFQNIYLRKRIHFLIVMNSLFRKEFFIPQN